MDGKEEGWAPDGQPIDLFVNDLSGDLRASLVRGLEDRGLYYSIFDIKRDPTITDGPVVPLWEQPVGMRSSLPAWV